MRHFVSAFALACAATFVVPATSASADSYNWPNSAFVGTDELPRERTRTSSGKSSKGKSSKRNRGDFVEVSAGRLGGGSVGMASYYWQPQRVASGGWFNPSAMTAAHKTLPFGTRVRVTHLGNGRSVDVTINDRGPFIAGRIIDLSKAAAGVIGMQKQGVARISMQVLGR